MIEKEGKHYVRFCEKMGKFLLEIARSRTRVYIKSVAKQWLEIKSRRGYFFVTSKDKANNQIPRAWRQKTIVCVHPVGDL